MGRRTPESKERLNALKRECTARGIRYVWDIRSIPKLEAILADPYEHQLMAIERYWDLKPFDFRGKGITPKRRAWVRWEPYKRYERKKYRHVGRFVEDLGNGRCVVSYPLWLGYGYRDRKIEIDIFQIVDYREDR